MEIRTNEPMARHTSFRVGGPADRFVIPDSETRRRERNSPAWSSRRESLEPSVVRS